jgi:hypothetical protein
MNIIFSSRLFFLYRRAKQCKALNFIRNLNVECLTVSCDVSFIIMRLFSIKKYFSNKSRLAFLKHTPLIRGVQITNERIAVESLERDENVKTREISVSHDPSNNSRMC